MAFAIYQLLLGALCLILHRIDAYPSGPPTGACTSLTPTGHNSNSQVGNAPYTITLDSNMYSPGQKITVTLSGVANMAFRGFFLQARRKDEFRDTTESLGTFSTAPTGTKLLTCHDNVDGSWSHSSNTDKMTSSIEWTAPNTFEGPIAFRATVVQGPATVYWENVLSEIIQFNGPTPNPDGTGGQSNIQPITMLLAVASGILSLLFLWQRV